MSLDKIIITTKFMWTNQPDDEHVNAEGSLIVSE